MKKVTIVIGVILAIWLGAVLHTTLFIRSVGVAVLVNESSEIVLSSEVSICDQVFKFTDIPAGKYAIMRYDVTSDSHYDVNATLKSGRIMNSAIGYVTHGINFFDVITVTDDEIIHAHRELFE